jgi:hypothetical protein
MPSGVSDLLTQERNGASTPQSDTTTAMSSTLEAARLNKSRVVFAAKNGKASGTKDDQAQRHVARAESNRGYVAALEAQLEDLKRMAAQLRAELTHVGAQRDMWRTKAEECRLAVLRATASRARPWWRRT